MANLGGAFDNREVEPNTGFPLLPAGEYLVQAVQSEMKPTKEGTGQRLNIEFDILDGEFKGQKLWDGLNIVNKSPQAQEIAWKQLSAFSRAAGKTIIEDSEELHLIPVIAVVKVIPKDGKYEERNEIKTYKPVGGATASSPSAATTTAAAAPKAATPPWKRAAA